MNRTVVVAALGTAQTLAWASSYYLPAILADPIAEGTGVSRTVVFGIFSGSLLLSAFIGPAVGRAIDQHGGRGVLANSNLVLAAGLVLLGFAHGIVPVRCLAAARHRHGDGALRAGLRDPHRALRPHSARANHRHYADRRLCQHGQLAPLRVL